MSFFNRYDVSMVRDFSGELDSMNEKILLIQKSAEVLNIYVDVLEQMGCDHGINIDLSGYSNIRRRLNWDYENETSIEDADEFDAAYESDLRNIRSIADELSEEHDRLMQQIGRKIENLRELLREVHTDSMLRELKILAD